MSLLLQIRNLSKSFQRGGGVFGGDGKAERFVAVNNVSFEVAARRDASQSSAKAAAGKRRWLAWFFG